MYSRLGTIFTVMIIIASTNQIAKVTKIGIVKILYLFTVIFPFNSLFGDVAQMFEK